jgi:CheY-like chemotaxis protein
MTHQLTGKRVLIVEDYDVFAIHLADQLVAEGASVIGPAATVTDALDVIASADLNGAILDVNLSGKAAFPVADALADRHIPFIFVTGYLIAHHVPARHANVRRFEKPIASSVICRAIEEAMSESI